MINTWIQTFVTFHEHTKKDPHPEGLNVNGAGDGLQLGPKTDIYLDILKELTHSSTVIFDIKSILKSDMK